MCSTCGTTGRQPEGVLKRYERWIVYCRVLVLHWNHALHGAHLDHCRTSSYSTIMTGADRAFSRAETNFSNSNTPLYRRENTQVVLLKLRTIDLEIMEHKNLRGSPLSVRSSWGPDITILTRTFIQRAHPTGVLGEQFCRASANNILKLFRDLKFFSAAKQRCTSLGPCLGADLTSQSFVLPQISV
jgi:hypothetical protein